MSGTFGSIASAPVIERYGGTEFFHKASSQYYRVVQRDGHTYQQRFEKDETNAPVRQFELEATHVIGSGRHARTYLHLSPAGELIELPLSWYTQEQQWAMSPGYDQKNNAGFTRVADAGCLFCHIAYPSGGQGRYGIRTSWPADSVPSGIDCQRCHGPGARHIELASHGVTGSQLKAAIVNPSRLTKDLALDVCLQCHLETTSSSLPHALRRFGRDVFSFQPGQPLSEYMLQFDHPRQANRSEKFEVNSAGYRLLQSPCFLKSGGRLTCVTCHNPHREERVSSQTCLQCHGPHSEPGRAECITCHMPARRTEDAVHVVITDHRIQRPNLQADPVAPRLETHNDYHGDVEFFQPYPLSTADRALYRGLALVTDGADVPRGAAILHAQLARQTKPPVEAVVGWARALSLLNRQSEAANECESALQLQPKLSAVRTECAKLLEQAGKRAQALTEYRKALASDPESPAAAFGIAGLTNDRAEAISLYRVAARSLPLRADALNNLGNLLTAPPTLTEARQVLEDALALNPQLASAENNLGRVDATLGQFFPAIQHTERALLLGKNSVEARFNHAQLMQAVGRVSEGIAEYRRILLQQPNFAAAHLALGNALADNGDFQGAINEFQWMLRMNPNDSDIRQRLHDAADLLERSKRQ